MSCSAEQRAETQQLGEPVLKGMVLNVMLPSLSTAEKDRIVAWYLGVSL